MKVKSPHETAGPFGKHHAHLGHFTKKEHINRGHNDNGRIAMAEKRIAELDKNDPNKSDDARWAYEVSRAFAGPKMNPEKWNAFEHSLNLKDQEREELERGIQQERSGGKK